MKAKRFGGAHHHGPAGPHGRALASRIMRDGAMQPAGFTGGADQESADRMAMRQANAGPSPIAPPGGDMPDTSSQPLPNEMES